MRDQDTKTPAVELGDHCKHLAELLEEELTGARATPLTGATSAEKDRRLKAVIAEIHTKQRAALCLSGGGIRSASFGLGALQALARNDVLGQVDYLSTVSGGGYIGGWLSAWIRNEKRGKEGVLGMLRTPPDDPTDPEWKPIRHLRSFSNYLTPQLGITSADTWTLIATVLRNILLNWLVLITMLVTLLLLPRLVIAAAYDPMPAWVLPLLLWGGFVCATITVAYAVADLPSTGRVYWREPSFVTWRLLPLLLSALLLSTWWAGTINGYTPEAQIENATKAYAWMEASSTFLTIAAFLGAAAIIANVAGWWIARTIVSRSEARKKTETQAVQSNDTRRKFSIGRLVATCLGTVVVAIVGGYVLQFAALHFPNPIYNIRLYVCFAPPLIIGIFLVSNFLLAGISSTTPFAEDEDREWWGRSTGWMLIAIVVWIGWTGLALFPPDLLAWVNERGTKQAIAAATGALSALIGVWTALKGSSTKTSGPQAAPSSRQWRLVAATVAFFILLSVTIGIGFGPAKALWVGRYTGVDRPALYVILGWSAGLAITSLVMSLFININKFSLHSMYRNRLIRAFLGASRTAKQEQNPPVSDTDKGPTQAGLRPHSIRDPHPFTGFDPADNFPLYELSPEKPLHIINMALNLVGGDELAWQERKAASFTASRLHCGSWQLGYRESKQYGGEGAISLGTAIAISGAAASPNMGYHSSPLVTLLMTLFNARLGWWLGNPGEAGERTWRKAGPRFALRPLLAEATGQTTKTYPYVYLSDGGHFDNLGIYEMVLRRCRYIIAIDAAGGPRAHLRRPGQRAAQDSDRSRHPDRHQHGRHLGERGREAGVTLRLRHDQLPTGRRPRSVDGRAPLHQACPLQGRAGRRRQLRRRAPGIPAREYQRPVLQRIAAGKLSRARQTHDRSDERNHLRQQVGGRFLRYGALALCGSRRQRCDAIAARLPHDQRRDGLSER